jgi:hypothetical protein
MTYRSTCNQTSQSVRGSVASVTLETQENGDAEAQNSPYIPPKYNSGGEIVFKSNEHQPCSLTDPNPDPDSPPVWLRNIDDMILTLGVSMAIDISYAFGPEPITYALTLTPAGLSLSSAGILSGTPTSVSNTQPICNATNANGTTGSNAFNIVVVDT